MKQRMIVTLLALLVVLSPTLPVAADDLNTSPARQSANGTKGATQAGADDNKARIRLGKTLLGIGTAVFAFGLAHPVPDCPYRPCGASTRDARVFVSGFVVATVGAWLLWKKAPVTSHVSAPIEGNRVDGLATRWCSFVYPVSCQQHRDNELTDERER
jgi:hypothetical protein